MKLCYIQQPWAYFSTLDPTEQTGEGWDKKPYEHNASPPNEAQIEYVRLARDEKEQTLRDTSGQLIFEKGSDFVAGEPKWRVEKLAFEDDWLTTPSERCFLNSGYSVKDLNSKKAAWLYDSQTDEKIYAGIDKDEFISAIRRRGGKIYLCTN